MEAKPRTTKAIGNEISRVLSKLKGIRTYVVAAQPGWALLERVQDGATERILELYENPVIAWRISIQEGGPYDLRPYMHVDPICAENSYPDWEQPLLQPDGRVVGGAATWASKEAYQAYLNDVSRGY